MKYIEAVTINIDSVDDSDLKSHIYASISYDRTSEYLSARQKLQDSLSNFIQYTNSLSFTESSKKQRELAYRIDEMLFELIQDNENKIDDIDKLIGNSTNKTILQSNPLDLKNFHRRFEYYQKDEFLHSEEYINAEDEMLDIYIIELLNDMRDKRESVKKEIISKYKNNSQDAADVQSKKQEELALWNVMDPVSQEMQMNKHKNMEKIYSVIEYYKNSNYRKMDYIKKLEIIKDNYLELEQNSYFHSYLYEFYKGLIKLNTSMDWNRDNFIQSGVAPEMINHIVYDLKRIYLIIDKYNISGQIEQIAQKNDNFLIAKQEFEKIKETYINNEYVNTNTNKLTSWSFAERMNKILKDIN